MSLRVQAHSNVIKQPALELTGRSSKRSLPRLRRYSKVLALAWGSFQRYRCSRASSCSAYRLTSELLRHLQHAIHRPTG